MRRRPFLLTLLAAPLLCLGCDITTYEAHREVVAPKEAARPVRLVVLAPALGVIARDLGLEDRIVGRHAWDMALGSSIPTVGTHDDPDLEAILRLAPTHVIVQDMEARVPESLRAMAESRGWTLWSFPLLTLDDIATATDELAARLLSTPDRGLPGFVASGGAGRDRPSGRLADAWSDRGEPARGAGRVLLLAATDPPGAMGPGSFHHQLVERLGARTALTQGGPWQELDHEDILRLAPDSIVLFRPRARDAEPGEISTDDALAALGGIAALDLPAIRDRRVALIDHPLGLLPASSLADVADEMADAFERWGREP